MADTAEPNGTVLERLKKGLFGDADNAEITSGTLAITRGTGFMAVGLVSVLVAIDALGWDPWDELASSTKFLIALGVLACWAVVAAADSIARGLAASKPDRAGVASLPDGLKATLFHDDADDEKVSVLAVRLPEDEDPAKATWLVASSKSAQWVEPKRLRFR